MAGIAARPNRASPFFSLFFACLRSLNTSLHTIRRYFVQLILHAIRVHIQVCVLSCGTEKELLIKQKNICDSSSLNRTYAPKWIKSNIVQHRVRRLVDTWSHTSNVCEIIQSCPLSEFGVLIGVGWRDAQRQKSVVRWHASHHMMRTATQTNPVTIESPN